MVSGCVGHQIIGALTRVFEIVSQKENWPTLLNGYFEMFAAKMPLEQCVTGNPVLQEFVWCSATYLCCYS
jgi:hypothetical protein